MFDSVSATVLTLATQWNSPVGAPSALSESSVFVACLAKVGLNQP